MACEVIQLPHREHDDFEQDVPHRSVWCRLRLRTMTGRYLKGLRSVAGKKSVLVAMAGYHLDRLACEMPEQQSDLIPLVLDCDARPTRPTLEKATAKLLDQDSARFPLRVFLRCFQTEAFREKAAGKAEMTKASVHGALERCSGLCEYRGVSFYEELHEKILQGFVPLVVSLCRQGHALGRMLDHVKPSVVISPVSVAAYHLLGIQCRARNIPAMVIPHKTLVTPKNGIEQIEETHIARAQIGTECAYVAAQSPFAAKYCERSGYSGEVVNTGPLTWSRVNEKRRGEVREAFFGRSAKGGGVVLYVPSMKSRASCRFHVVETLDEIFSSMSDIVHAVRELPGARLVVRLHPGGAIEAEDIRTLIDMDDSVVIHNRGPFEDALALADVVVSYSSTATEEALFNRIPLVLYDKWRRYNHLSAPEWQQDMHQGPSPAYYISAPTMLAEALRRILRNKISGRVPCEEAARKYSYPKGKDREFHAWARALLGES